MDKQANDLFWALEHKKILCKVDDSDDQHKIILILPGMTKNDFTVETQHRLLYVYGPQRINITIMDLPINADTTSGKAVYQNEQLVVTFNLQNTHQIRKIQVD